jgi:hypothetical protein
MGDRLTLHTLLTSILGSDNVYFQPPESISLKYPCIIYKRDYIKTDHADNSPYTLGKRYSVTVIDKNPDSVIPDNIAALPTCSFERHFTADNLNHDIFNLYF